MEIIKVLQIFGSLEMGGAESRMMDVYRNIDKEEYTFDFLAMTGEIGFYEDELNKSGATVIHISNPRRVSFVTHIKQLYKVMKNGKYDAVHAHTSYHCGIALFAAWLSGVKVRIAHARTTGSKQTSKKAKIFNFIGRFLIRLFSTKRLAISNVAGKFLFGEQKFTVVPNTINLAKYSIVSSKEIENLKSELQIPDNAFIVGQIGRFEKMKNHKFTLKWFSEYLKLHNDTHLVLIGDGGLKQETEEYVKELNIEKNVTFTGVRSDVPKLIQVFDVLLFPSLFEGLGGVALEAQAVGIPIVESEGIPDEADLGLGLVHKCSLSDDLKVWNEAVDRCRQKIVISQATIKEAFEMKGYSIDSVVDIYCKIYRGKLK